LKELRKGDIDEIFDLAKKKKIEGANNRVKIRDSLILLSRKGYVKKENDKWIVVHERVF
jgi:hypothetical protein